MLPPSKFVGVLGVLCVLSACRLFADEPAIVEHPNLTAKEKAIRDALKAPTDFAFSQTPLTDVAKYFQDKYHIEIKFDMIALKNADPSIDPSETLITRNLKNVTLAEGLHTILSDYGLTYLVIDEQLRITSNHEAEHIMCVDFYDVHDLIPPGERADREAAIGQLTNVLTSTVEPYNWVKVKPSGGSVEYFDNGDICVLVVYQTQLMHEEIEDVLTNLRKFKTQKPATDATVR